MSEKKNHFDQPNSANNASTGTAQNHSAPENSAEELEELGNRMCNCLLARKFPHRASKCFKAAIGRVADEIYREDDEESKRESYERGCFVPTGQTGAKPDPQLGSNAHCGKVPDTEQNVGQKPNTEYRNTHHQDTPNPRNQINVGDIFADFEVQGTEQNVGQKPNTRNKNNQHQKTHNSTDERNVGQTPGSQKNHHHNRQQKNSSEKTIIHQKPNPNSKELKAQHPHPHPAPRQTVIKSTTVKTTTTIQTVTRGPKK